MALSTGGSPLSIANGITESARAWGGRTAIIDGDRVLTFAEVADRARRLANTLLGHGLATGDRVAILLGNRAEYIEAAAGIAMAGLVMVPLNPRLTAPECAYILEDSGARVVIADTALAGSLPGHEEGSRAVPTLLLDDTDGSPYEQALAAASPDDPMVTVAETEPFCIAYTSGTTGRPKGVVISHRSRSLTFLCSALEWGLGPGRRSIAVAPLYHGAGFAFGYAPPYTGGSVVMLRRWDPVELLRLIERHRVQSCFLVPTHAQMLRSLDPEVIASVDLSSLDTLYFNAAALPTALKEWVTTTFPHVGVHELYGSTESGIISNLRPADSTRKPGSVGPPWFLTEVRVVGADGEPVRPGEVGRLYSRSPFLMNGYHGLPEATAACTTDDGFVTCGDLVRVDEEGFLSIIDRVDDQIITGGVNVYPREVEEVLAAHPQIVEVAVVGKPSETWGQEIAAYVVRTPGSTIDERDLVDACRQRLAGFKIPRQWSFVDALPRNAAGKILKTRLR